MSYRNKTYVIFDGDEDMWAYAFMKGWKTNDNIDFSFHDAHHLRPLTGRASEATVKEALRKRMANAKQVLVLVGAKTKNLHRFVRWEIESAMAKDLPIIVVNLNNKRSYDDRRCPPILRGHCAVHVAFKCASSSSRSTVSSRGTSSPLASVIIGGTTRTRCIGTLGSLIECRSVLDHAETPFYSASWPKGRLAVPSSTLQATPNMAARSG